jgi:hypothetical protein
VTEALAALAAALVAAIAFELRAWADARARRRGEKRTRRSDAPR